MKRSNWLLTSFMILPTLALTTSVSCSQPLEPDAEKYADYIFNPIDLPQEETTNQEFMNKVMNFTNDENDKEVIYDLFGFFNIKNFMNLQNNDSFRSLYKNSIVGIKTNIGKFETKNELLQRQNFTVTFLGYISMVFLEDYKNAAGDTIYKQNDYVMITYDIKNFIISPDGNNASFQYRYPLQNGIKRCVGVIKQRINEHEYTYSIESIDTYADYEGLPSNSKNLIIL